MSEETRYERETRGMRCTVCEVVGGHAPGCREPEKARAMRASKPLIVTSLADALTAIAIKDQEVERLTIENRTLRALAAGKIQVVVEQSRAAVADTQDAERYRFLCEHQLLDADRKAMKPELDARIDALRTSA